MAANGINLRVEEITHGKGALCRLVLEVLPDWFGIPSAVDEYVRAVESMPAFALMAQGKSVGLLAIDITPEMAPDLHVMGILPEFHRLGGGRLLVEAASDWLRMRGKTLFTVKTLSESREDAGYAATRKFYLAVGFEPVMEIPSLWGLGNPCLLLAKRI